MFADRIVLPSYGVSVEFNSLGSLGLLKESGLWIDWGPQSDCSFEREGSRHSTGTTAEELLPKVSIRRV